MFDGGTEAVRGQQPITEPITDPAAASDLELTQRATELERRRTALDAEAAVVLGELEARQVTDRDHGLKTAAWLAREAALPAPVARNRVRVATKLRRYLPLVADALAARTIGWEHARVLADAANPRIRATVTDNQEMLLGLAHRCRFEQWTAEVRSLTRLWDQDGGYDPNADPTTNRLSYGTTLDGLVTLTATLTGDNAEIITHPPGGSHIVPGRYHRNEDPTATAHARQLILRRLAALPRPPRAA